MNYAAIIFILIAFSCGNSFSAERIVIETKNDNFFENVVSDTLLLLDPELKKIIADDFAHVVNESRFNVQVNSWKPRRSPKGVLVDIYNDTNKNNIKYSFASAIQPIVELACTKRNDQLNDLQSKCIKELFKYPIIHTIQFRYTYDSKKTIEQDMASLSDLNDGNRYQQIVRIVADIMNRAFEKAVNKHVIKNVLVVKYPLPIFAGIPNKEKESEELYRGAVAGQEQAARDRETKAAADKVAAKIQAAEDAESRKKVNMNPIFNTATGIVDPGFRTIV